MVTAATSIRNTYHLEVAPYDAVSGAAVDVRATTAKRWNTGSGDTPASAIYRPGLEITGFGSAIYSLEQGMLGGFVDLRAGEATFPNTNGDCDPWLRYSWIDRTLTLYKVAPNAAHSTRTAELRAYVTSVTVGQKHAKITFESYNSRLSRKRVTEAKFWGRKQGLRFQSADAQDRISFSTNHNFTSSFTLEFFMRISSAIANACICQKGDASNGYDLNTGGTAGTEFRLHIRNAGTAFSVSGAAGSMVVGEWGLFSAVFDTTANELRLFKNGQLLATQTGVTIDPASTLNNCVVGANSAVNARWLDGEIGEIRFWNIARTQQQINENLYGGLNGVPSGLVGWIKFGEGTGTALNDETSTNADGTVTGATWIGTYEGEEDVAGKRKPWAIGKPYHVEPVLIDSVKWIYAFSVRGLQAQPNVFDGGFPVDADTSPNTTDLFNATVAAGKFKYDSTRGLIRLGSAAEKRVSVTFEALWFLSGTLDTALPEGALPCIVRESGGFGAGDISVNGADFSGFGSIIPMGLYVRDGEMNCLEAAGKVLHTYRAYGGFDDLGVFRAMTLSRSGVSNTSVMTLTAEDVRDLVVIGTIPPVKEILFGYRPYWPPYGESDFVNATSVSTKNDLKKAVRQQLIKEPTDRYGRAWTDYGEDARSLTIDSLISVVWAQNQFCQPIFDAHDTFVPVWQCKALNPLKRPKLGDVVTLDHPRLLGAAVKCLVVGTSRNYTGSMVHQTVQLMDATTLCS